MLRKQVLNLIAEHLQTCGIATKFGLTSSHDACLDTILSPAPLSLTPCVEVYNTDDGNFERVPLEELVDTINDWDPEPVEQEIVNIKDEMLKILNDDSLTQDQAVDKIIEDLLH